MGVGSVHETFVNKDALDYSRGLGVQDEADARHVGRPAVVAR
jgi:hypothetical protein